MIKQLLPLLATCDLTITFAEKEGTLTLIVVPKTKIDTNGKKETKFKPIVLSGTSDEVEEGWIEAISVPLKKIKGLQINTAAFDKSVTSIVEEAKADAEKKATREKAAKKQAEVKSTEKKPAELVKEYVAKGDEFFKNKQYKEAEASYQDALAHKAGDKAITVKLQNAQRWVKAQANIQTDILTESSKVGIVDETPILIEPEVSMESSPLFEGPGESEDNPKQPISTESEDKDINDDDDFSLK